MDSQNNTLQLCKDMIDMTKIKMLGASMGAKYPYMKFYTVVLASLQKQYTDIGSAATDGKRLFIDPNFIAGHDESYIENEVDILVEYLTKKGEDSTSIDDAVEHKKIWLGRKSIEEVAFVLAHEARHIIGNTMTRGKIVSKANWKFVNIAADYQINNRLCWEMFKGDITRMRKSLPLTKCLYLSDNYFKIEKGVYIEWTMEEILKDLLDNAPQEECYLLDEHMDFEEGSVEQAKRAIINANRSGIGVSPDDVKKQVEEWLNPKIIWHEYLDRNMKSCVTYDFNYSVPCESSWADSIVLKDMGFIGENNFIIHPSPANASALEVVVVFDTSGSVFNDKSLVSALCSELSGILEQFMETKVHLMCFDTSIRNYQKYDSMNISDISDYQLTGGGGSSIKGLKSFMEENNIPKKNVVIFTDLFIGIDWEDYKDYSNLTWVVFGNPTANVPYGFKINY